MKALPTQDALRTKVDFLNGERASEGLSFEALLAASGHKFEPLSPAYAFNSKCPHAFELRNEIERLKGAGASKGLSIRSLCIIIADAQGNGAAYREALAKSDALYAKPAGAAAQKAAPDKSVVRLKYPADHEATRGSFIRLRNQ